MSVICPSTIGDGQFSELGILLFSLTGYINKIKLFARFVKQNPFTLFDNTPPYSTKLPKKHVILHKNRSEKTQKPQLFVELSRKVHFSAYNSDLLYKYSIRSKIKRLVSDFGGEPFCEKYLVARMVLLGISDAATHISARAHIYSLSFSKSDA